MHKARVVEPQDGETVMIAVDWNVHNDWRFESLGLGRHSETRNGRQHGATVPSYTDGAPALRIVCITVSEKSLDC